ncbi:MULTISPECIES: SPFH domain-containing protein [Lysinibacillus]|uniref:SPFH domain-containing protein n=1 Tax=Lysinibacillus capsici TaxID=2115968 RepID=A0ABY8KNX5_9BACI|nr:MULTISPECIES: SPFH domain-containing protein [Lysinibacillus]KMN40275.1 virion core protein (lumpy skin disease virus) [Lysinibacillus sp. LK3]MED3798456.1 SPFH domain-containing protein [Lysinibacillus capsici]OCX62637.1 virion core protein (lumpy skin disease virus) [Lysinibacillus sp. AR18-8]RDV32923.1 SPFH domain-containing protein [Lysinibacillus capsici]WGF39481.1 SPFH domain-containing protein [Lysinibacillus capsici]
MGLLKAGVGALTGVLEDQWREYFYCEALSSDVLVTKGIKRTSKRGSNKGNDNIISNGSIIAINEGQCMMIVEQGKVVEFSSEAGEYVYDTSTEPSIMYGSDLSHGIMETFKQIGKRFTFGGEPAKDQRVYYFNKKEIVGNKYGTPAPIPFRVIDRNIGLDIDIAIRCHGEYSYRIIDPLLFYTNVCGNVEREYTREAIDSQLKSELMTALQPAFAQISASGVRYSEIPAHTVALADALNKVLSEKWLATRGLAVVSFGISTLKASEEDEAMIKQLQRNAVMRDPGMAAAHLTGAQAEAMIAAANNDGGAMAGFMGMNMAAQAGGVNAGQLYQMNEQNKQAQMAQAAMQNQSAKASGTWTCACGHDNTGKFCSNCGAAKPAEEGWTCTCGAVNKGKFCSECGSKKPAGALLYACDKCGWAPEDPANPPKFCPECGDVFDEKDVK